MRSGQAATPAAKHLWGYRESTICAAQPHAIWTIMTSCTHAVLHTCGRETERRRHCGNEEWICAVAECRCRHDTMSKLQVAILDRSSREMFQTVHIDLQYILSRVRVSVRRRIFFIREKHQKLSRIPRRIRDYYSSPAEHAKRGL